MPLLCPIRRVMSTGVRRIDSLKIPCCRNLWNLVKLSFPVPFFPFLFRFSCTMARGVDLTLQVIAQSKNQAAVGLLESAFQSTSEIVRKLVGSILVSRRSGKGLEVIIRNFDPTNAYIVGLVNNNRDKLMPGLHGAIVDKDIDLARKAFRLAYTQNFYEVLPTLAAYYLGSGSQEKGGLSLRTDFLKFLDKYTAALEKNNPAEHHVLYSTVLPEFTKILTQKIKEYRFTRNELTLLVYLRLYPFFLEAGADRDLYLQLRLPNSPIYVSAYRRLLKESEPYLFQLITRCFNRLNPPPFVPQVIAGRADIPFLKAFLKGIKQPVTLELKTNLAKLPALTWINQISSYLGQLDEESQCGLVLLLQNIELKTEELSALLLKIFEHCSGAGRAAVLSALAPFSGAEIDRLVWNAAGDPDPAVQVEALTQLSSREISGAPARMVQFIGSPHEQVRDTIHELLPNFRFSRFLQTFDQLDDESRRRMFNVVRSLDKRTPSELTKMLCADEPILKAKALLCIDYCREIVPLVEEALCEILMSSEVPTLRSKAAEQLVAGRRESSRTVLVQALHRDESPEVRAVAKKSLEERPASWAAPKN